MQLRRISLATKYRILFGLAVLLIIGAALAVPWYYMEALILEQPFREAQALTESYFSLIMAEPDAARDWGGGMHGGRFDLLDDRAQPTPHFIPLTPSSGEVQGELPGDVDAEFVSDTLRTFRRFPNEEFYYRTPLGPTGRRFQYAHAVWVTRRCLECHGEGSVRPYRENQLAGVIAMELPAEQSRQSSFINRVVIVAAGALAGILAILVFYVITTRFILAPIHELRYVALRVADGDLGIRSTVRTGDEFEQLSENLNTMLERLRGSQEELRKANRLLDEKLEQMAEANVALFEANRLKSEFLANVSHELRTPLTSIIGFAELLRESPQADDTRAGRYAENILISGRILLEIINDLLDLAKLEAGKTEVHVESVRIEDACSTLLDHVRPLADKKSLRLSLQVDDELPAIFTDPGKVRQILFNYVSNAIKFTPEGGQIWIGARRESNERVLLSVRDTGPGINPEHHETIFEKFRQIDQSATREHHGTGLGLAIARELAHLLGGEVGVESQLGHGATFWLRLPTTAPEPRDRRPVSLL